MLAPFEVYAAPRDLMTLAKSVSSLIDTAVFVLITFGIVLYFYGLGTNISTIAKDPEKRKHFFVWGLCTIFVMVSIWGIVALLKNTLFGSIQHV